MPERFYDDDEAEAILRIASHSTSAGMSHDKLLETAAELGISPEAVEEAAASYQAQKAEQNLRNQFDVYIKRSFFSHLAAYVIVNTGLFAMNVATGIQHLWFIFPLLGWGIGLAFSFGEAFLKNSDDYEEEFQKWRAKRGLSSGQLAAKFLEEQPRSGAGLRSHIQLQIDLKKRDAKEPMDQRLGH